MRQIWYFLPSFQAITSLTCAFPVWLFAGQSDWSGLDEVFSSDDEELIGYFDKELQNQNISKNHSLASCGPNGPPEDLQNSLEMVRLGQSANNILLRQAHQLNLS